MNPLTSTIEIKLLHRNMSDAQFQKLLERIAKAAKGRSNRSAGVRCGKHSTWLWGRDDK
jgi:hypothetical protein